MTYKELMNLIQDTNPGYGQVVMRLLVELLKSTVGIIPPTVTTWVSVKSDDIRDLIVAHNFLRQSYDERERVIERLTKEFARLEAEKPCDVPPTGFSGEASGRGESVPVSVMKEHTVENCPHRMDSKLTPGFWCATSRNSRCDLVRHYGNCQWLGPNALKEPTT